MREMIEMNKEKKIFLLLLLSLFLIFLQMGQVYGWAVVPTHPELTEEAFDTLEQSGACTFSPHYKFVATSASMVSHTSLMGAYND